MAQADEETTELSDGVLRFNGQSALLQELLPEDSRLLRHLASGGETSAAEEAREATQERGAPRVLLVVGEDADGVFTNVFFADEGISFAGEYEGQGRVVARSSPASDLVDDKVFAPAGMSGLLYAWEPADDRVVVTLRGASVTVEDRRPMGSVCADGVDFARSYSTSFFEGGDEEQNDCCMRLDGLAYDCNAPAERRARVRMTPGPQRAPLAREVEDGVLASRSLRLSGQDEVNVEVHADGRLGAGDASGQINLSDLTASWGSCSPAQVTLETPCADEGVGDGGALLWVQLSCEVDESPLSRAQAYQVRGTRLVRVFSEVLQPSLLSHYQFDCDAGSFFRMRVAESHLQVSEEAARNAFGEESSVAGRDYPRVIREVFELGPNGFTGRAVTTPYVYAGYEPG